MGEGTTRQSTGRRIVLLDYLRGVGILFVMWYHLMYDLSTFYGICNWIFSTAMDVFRDCMVAMLVLISGICCHFSRSNLRRGIICFLIAMGLTGVTYLMDSQCYIRFGVLHMFGISMLLYGIVSPYLMVKRPWVWAIGCLIGFLFTFLLSRGALGFYRLPLIPLPDGLYQTRFLFWLGLPDSAFVSADYYPLLPWTLLFFAGGFLGYNFQHLPKCDKMPQIKTLSFIGRNTLPLYLIHQPLYYAVFWLLSLLQK